MSAPSLDPVPMVDLHRQYLSPKDDIDAAPAGVLEKPGFVMGENVEAFEAESGEYPGVEHVISCANGKDGLQLAMWAIGPGPGDEVFTTPFTLLPEFECS